MGTPITQKNVKDIQIYTQNVNGIKMGDLRNHVHHKLNVMTDQEVDIYGWSETNLEWNDNQVYQTMQNKQKNTTWEDSGT